MIIKHKQKQEKGDEKTLRKFLFLPKRIGDETRWLEFVKIKYRKEFVVISIDGMAELKWVAKEFINKTASIKVW